MDQPQPASPEFQLPRVSRVATRRQDGTPPWALLLSTICFAAVILLTILGPRMTMANTGSQNATRQLGYAVIFALSLIATRPWRYPERLLLIPWPLLAALAWCWLSLAWAISPETGLRRVALTTIIIVSLFTQVRLIGIARTEAVLRVLLIATLVANFAVVAFDPKVGVHSLGTGDLAGWWCGMMVQKNYAGITCVVLVLLFAFDAARIHWALRTAVIAPALLFLAATGSKTSIGIGLAALAVGGLFALAARRRGAQRLAPPWVAWLLLILPALAIAAMAVDDRPFLYMVSDPAAFTGRTQIWTALIKAYADRPVLGVGYGSFWDLGPSGPIYRYASGWVTSLSEGHQGYLDLLVQIGALGTLLVLFAAVVWPTQRLLTGGDHPARPLGAALVLFCVGHNFTESQLFDRDALVQVFLMISIAMLWTVTASPTGGPATRALRQGVSSEPTRARAPLRL